MPLLYPQIRCRLGRRGRPDVTGGMEGTGCPPGVRWLTGQRPQAARLKQALPLRPLSVQKQSLYIARARACLRDWSLAGRGVSCESISILYFSNTH